MDKKYNLSFIACRIKEIGSALMHDLGNSSFEKVPADIVTVLKTDEDGSIWFFIKRPAYTGEMPLSFPVSLQFLRKGKNFFIKATGMARSTWNYDPVKSFINYTNPTTSDVLLNLTLVQVKINAVEYCEYDTQKKEENRLITWVRNVCRQWFDLPDYTRHSVARITLH